MATAFFSVDLCLICVHALEVFFENQTKAFTCICSALLQKSKLNMQVSRGGFNPDQSEPWSSLFTTPNDDSLAVGTKLIDWWMFFL